MENTQGAKPKKVLLFLAHGFEALEAAVFTDVMGWSRSVGNEAVELYTTGLRTEVQCTWNFKVLPELAFEAVSVDDFDALAIAGGFEEAGFYEDAFDPRFLQLIRDFDTKKKIIATVCVAALPLGKAGILQGKKATTYSLTNQKRSIQLADFGAIVQNEPIVVADNLITSDGPSAAIDVAFTLLLMLTNADNVEIVRREMRY
jgi:4-methyl-5(b-hydroxyethyl)-thiazole monophosphate biosynthesis